MWRAKQTINTIVVCSNVQRVRGVLMWKLREDDRLMVVTLLFVAAFMLLALALLTELFQSAEVKCHKRILSLVRDGLAEPADLRFCATVRPRSGEER